MGRLGQGFPDIQVWQTMSEGEQDALIVKLERARRRSDVFTSVLVAALVVAAMSGLLYLVSSQMP